LTGKSILSIQQRLLRFITWTNWILFFIASLLGCLIASKDFALGIIFGGLIVTVNFHLLYKTLKGAFTPPVVTSHHKILAKYYIRFVISGILIFILISGKFVNPLGLFIGLSVVVASIVLATCFEVKKIIFKEAF